MSNDTVTLLRDATDIQTTPESRGYESLQATPPDDNVFAQPDIKPKKLPQYVAALSAALSAVASGAALGWTSPILDYIEAGKFNDIPVNNAQMGWIGSFITLGAMTMCFPTGFICDLTGRKGTIILLTVPFSVGWLLILNAHSLMMFYVGRLLTGMAVGASCVAVPLYSSEISLKENRGALGSYFQFMITVGIFIAYLFGKVLTPLNYTIFCSILPFYSTVLLVFQPESPVYCLKRGKYEQACISLLKLRGSDYNINNELREIEENLKENAEIAVSLGQTLRRKCNRRALTIAFALMFLQQFSGINAVILYTSDIFSASGANFDPNAAVIVVGAFQVVATFASSLIVDKLGRRIILISSTLVMALSLATLALFFTLKNRVRIGDELEFMPVAAVCVFIGMFSLGLGPIPWTISSEIFGVEIKSVASSAAATFNWFLAFLVTKFYLTVSQEVGQDTTFYVFAVVSLLGACFIHFALPETKGKTISEIQAELGS